MKERAYRAAIYLRLSREDGDKEESNSISNQKQLIYDYIKKHEDIDAFVEMIDDGFSGANFDRPAFIEMMGLVKEGKINCIIVKDLSRFGRNYIEAGRYIEEIFPFLGVRFIGINDDYDSIEANKNGYNMIIPFKNLINDAYCRDISVKIRSQLDIKRKKGDFIGAFASFGYMKSPQNKNVLEIDPYAAQIVRQIFAMKISGLSNAMIADKLNQQGVYSPARYKKAGGLAYHSGFATQQDLLWSAVAIGRILENELYIGTMVQAKRASPNFRIKQRVEKPSAEWMRVSNNHAPIISKSDFQLVNRLLSYDTRSSPTGIEKNNLAGVLVCGDCGQNMLLKTNKIGSKNYTYYVCSTHKAHKACSMHSISKEKLEQAILACLQKYIALMVDPNRMLAKLAQEQTDGCVENIQNELHKAEIIRYQKYLQGVFEDYRDEILDKEEYVALSDIYKAKINRILEMSATESVVQKEKIGYQEITALSRPLIVYMIQHIRIYEGGLVEIGLNFF